MFFSNLNRYLIIVLRAGRFLSEPIRTNSNITSRHETRTSLSLTVDIELLPCLKKTRRVPRTVVLFSAFELLDRYSVSVIGSRGANVCCPFQILS